MAIYTAVLAGARVFATPLWGRVLDRIGARPVLVVCSVGSALVSTLWMLAAPARLWPIALDAMLSGVLLGGQGLAAFAIPLSVAPRTRTSRCHAALGLRDGREAWRSASDRSCGGIC